jgi:hypothetical protein
MGQFNYDDIVQGEFDDRVLAHLQTVIGAKLRRDEPFFFTWRSERTGGSGRDSVWVHAGASIVFTFRGSRVPHINRAWLEALMQSANSAGGLQIVPEPPESDEAAPVVG